MKAELEEGRGKAEGYPELLDMRTEEDHLLGTRRKPNALLIRYDQQLVVDQSQPRNLATELELNFV